MGKWLSWIGECFTRRRIGIASKRRSSPTFLRRTYCGQEKEESRKEEGSEGRYEEEGAEEEGSQEEGGQEEDRQEEDCQKEEEGYQEKEGEAQEALAAPFQTPDNNKTGLPTGSPIFAG